MALNVNRQSRQSLCQEGRSRSFGIMRNVGDALARLQQTSRHAVREALMAGKVASFVTRISTLRQFIADRDTNTVLVRPRDGEKHFPDGIGSTRDGSSLRLQQ